MLHSIRSTRLSSRSLLLLRSSSPSHVHFPVKSMSFHSSPICSVRVKKHHAAEAAPPSWTDQAPFTEEEADDYLKQVLEATSKSLVKLQLEHISLPEEKPALELEKWGEYPKIGRWQALIHIVASSFNDLAKEHPRLCAYLRTLDEDKETNAKQMKKTRENLALCWDPSIELVYGKEFMEPIYRPSSASTKTDFTRTEVRRYAQDLCDHFLSEDALKSISTALAKSSDDQGVMLRNVLSRLHLEVLPKYGFEGEDGYLYAQRSLLVNHPEDTVVQQCSETVQKLIIRQAGGN